MSHRLDTKQSRMQQIFHQYLTFHSVQLTIVLGRFGGEELLTSEAFAVLLGSAGGPGSAGNLEMVN